ncbi:hypothetical protein I5403_11900 [Citrobacter farmeri]|uniref:hypothetical protein n=1 Tax=Citrobacter farmeri TaxID=67824 RepID=UPI0019210431|nr:hypothetical protein [Citrobacter farmeri]MBJ8746021.1 hypothetical protein [Citrobacter farmeri]MBJ8759272.1 hypothetical protein [Citrobacter farmeri]HAT6800628.1 hypothetical protein [Citrobacter freundii]
MAKYSVNSFSVYTRVDQNEIERVYLEVELINSSGNPKKATYSMTDDTRATTQGIINALNQGFAYAQHNYAKVGISEFKERMYLFFDLPSAQGKQSYQFTGKKI